MLVNPGSLVCSWWGDICIPPTPGSGWGWHWHTLQLAVCSISSSCPWREKKQNGSHRIWNGEVEWSSGVTETLTKKAGRWCNKSYSAPREANLRFINGLDFCGRYFCRDYCSVANGLYIRLCDRLGVEHCLYVYSCSYSSVELVIYLVYRAF